MKLFILAALIVAASALEDEVSSKIKDKRQILGPLGYGGVGYGLGYGLGYGGFYPGGFYPGVVGPGFYGRKRREVAEDIEEVDDESAKEKRQVFLGGYPGVLPVGGYGYGLGYGLPVAGYGMGLGYGGFYGRKRRDVSEEEESTTKDKRQVLLGGLGYGYGGLGYGGYGYGYPGAFPMLGGINTGFGYPAVIGRKRRDIEETADKTAHEKRHIIGAYPGFGYGGFGYGYPGVIGGYGYGYPGMIGGFGYPPVIL